MSANLKGVKPLHPRARWASILILSPARNSHGGVITVFTPTDWKSAADHLQPDEGDGSSGLVGCRVMSCRQTGRQTAEKVFQSQAGRRLRGLADKLGRT